eukprot:gene11499-biopygen4864
MPAATMVAAAPPLVYVSACVQSGHMDPGGVCWGRPQSNTYCRSVGGGGASPCNWTTWQPFGVNSASFLLAFLEAQTPELDTIYARTKNASRGKNAMDDTWVPDLLNSQNRARGWRPLSLLWGISRWPVCLGDAVVIRWCTHGARVVFPKGRSPRQAGPFLVIRREARENMDGCNPKGGSLDPGSAPESAMGSSIKILPLTADRPQANEGTMTSQDCCFCCVDPKKDYAFLARSLPPDRPPPHPASFLSVRSRCYPRRQPAAQRRP